MAGAPKPMTEVATRADAERLDAGDPLGRFKEAFDLPDGVIYLDGNSLGPLPKATPARLEEVARKGVGRRSDQILGQAWLDGLRNPPRRQDCEVDRCG